MTNGKFLKDSDFMVLRESAQYTVEVLEILSGNPSKSKWGEIIINEYLCIIKRALLVYYSKSNVNQYKMVASKFLLLLGIIIARLYNLFYL